MPAISVILPAYNHAAYIAAAINSVLSQQAADLELIVIDDASSDDTWSKICAINDVRLKAFRHAQNQGAVATLNEGVSRAQASRLAFLNSDDIFLPQRLARALQVLDQNPALGAVFSAYEFIDEQAVVIRSAAAIQQDFPPQPTAAALQSSQISNMLRLFAFNFLHSTSNLICKKSVIDALGGFREYRYVHDHDFFLRLSVQFQWEMLDDCLLQYRHHGSNTLSESASRSVLETACMRLNFVQHGGLPLIAQTGDAGQQARAYLLSHARWYGAESWMLLQLLARYSSEARTMPQDFVFEARDEQRLQPLVEADQQHKDMRWQQAQTQLWWEKACNWERQVGELASRVDQGKRDLQWQKAQTDHWWTTATKLEAERDYWQWRHRRARWLGVPYALERLRARLTLNKNRY